MLLLATYWHLVAPPVIADLKLKQTQMGHACEWETSMILRLAPNLVGEFKNLRPVDFGNPFEPASRAWITKDRTEPGHIGAPNEATPQKGEQLFRVFTDGVVSVL